MPARRYAERTSVPVERSRAELERLLETHGAQSIAVYRDSRVSVIVYRLAGRMIRHEIAFPDGAGTERQEDAEFRRRWRVLILLVKAKLEAIASGDSTVDREFLADTLLPDGQTVYAASSASIAESYRTGGMPPLLLGMGDGGTR